MLLVIGGKDKAIRPAVRGALGSKAGAPYLCKHKQRKFLRSAPLFPPRTPTKEVRNTRIKNRNTWEENPKLPQQFSKSKFDLHKSKFGLCKSKFDLFGSKFEPKYSSACFGFSSHVFRSFLAVGRARTCGAWGRYQAVGRGAAWGFHPKETGGRACRSAARGAGLRLQGCPNGLVQLGSGALGGAAPCAGCGAPWRSGGRRSGCRARGGRAPGRRAPNAPPRRRSG